MRRKREPADLTEEALSFSPPASASSRTPQASEGVVVVFDGQMAYCDAALARIMGRSFGGLKSWIRRQWEAASRADDRRRDRRSHRDRMLGCPGPLERVHRLVKADGSTVWLRVHVDWIEYRGRRALRIACVDITAQRHAEETYRNLAEHSLQGLLVVQHHRIVYANQASCDMIGYTARELYALPPYGFKRIVAPVDRATFLRRYADRLAGSSAPSGYEARFLHKDGRAFWVSIYSSVTTFRGERAAQAAFMDITNRKRLEESLLQSEANFRSLAENADMAIIVRAPTGKALYVNGAACRMTGYSRRELLGMRQADMTDPAEARRIAHLVRRHLKGQKFNTRLETALRHKDGRQILVEATSSRTTWKGAAAAMALVRDVTELRALEEEVFRIEVSERQRVGQDIHDGICQQLAGVGYLSQSLEERLRRRNAPEASDMAQITRTVGATLRQVSKLSCGMSAFSISEEGLPSALRRMAAEMSRLYFTPCRVIAERYPPTGDPVAATHLLHIAREAVSNAMRHARPSEVIVRLSVGRRGGSLTISDDGRGMSRTARPRPGMGLRTMQHRTDLIGGGLAVRSRAGRGTSVTCTFPLGSPPKNGAARGRKGQDRLSESEGIAVAAPPGLS